MELLRTTVIENPYIPKILHGHQFPSMPQAYFLTLPQMEVLFGGAAGGGKTFALLAAALQYVMVPGYSAIIFRRTFTDLEMEGGLIQTAHDWLSDTDAEWDGGNSRWHFPSGAAVSFGYMQNKSDHLNYKGPPWQAILFDETTSFPEHQYLFMFSRLRAPIGMNVPLRMRGATNPGDRGAAWVKRRFGLRTINGKTYANNTLERYFVPAKLADNPGLNQVEYRKALAKLDPVTRAQMEGGDWSITAEGNMFKRAWFKIVERAPIMERTVRVWDLAATEPSEKNDDPDYTVGLKMGVDARGNFYILHIIQDRITPGDTEDLIKSTAMSDGRDVAIVLKEEPGSSGKTVTEHYARDVLPGYNFRAIKDTGPKMERAKPLSAACQHGFIYLVQGAFVESFLDEIAPYPSEGIHDDQVDAGATAHQVLTGGFAEMEDDFPVIGATV